MTAKNIAPDFGVNKMQGMTLMEAREAIAARALADGHVVFAREVRSGCWDHRNDVQAAMAGRPLKPLHA